MNVVVLNLLILSILGFASELLWVKKRFTAETSRKFMHFFGGLLAATWPLYMSWRQIQILIVMAVVGIVFLRITGVAKSFFAVRRKSYGDILGPLTIGLLAAFSPPDVLFVLVVLQVTLADGMATVVGLKFGSTNTYHVLGVKKSVAGTLACFVVSFAVISLVYIVGDFSGSVSLLALWFIPVAVTSVENISVYGIDNTLIALTVGALAKLFNFY